MAVAMFAAMGGALFANGSKETSASSGAKSVTLMAWHDQGEKGVNWFNALNDLYSQDHPGVKVESVTYPTQQWIEKSIAALNTNTAPDLLFNNYERVIRVEDQTHKISDLSSAFKTIGDTSYLSDGDLAVTKYANKMIIFPIQRVQMAFGVRKSWLERVGKSFPENWDQMVELAKQFTNGDPDGNGKNGDTFGLALEAANPRDLVHMIDLFSFGSGIKHTIIDPQGNITINEPQHKAIVKAIIGLYRNYVPKDTVNYSFNEMYQIIEGGKAGMFRVGDWNVNKWDQPDVLNGDYEIGAWPAFKAGEKHYVVIGGMRGVAVPENAPNRDAAVEFAKFMLSKEAQKLSFKFIGSSVRGDWSLDLTPHQAVFAHAKFPLVAYDFPETEFSYYPAIEEIYHKALLKAITDSSVNVDQLLADTESQIKAYIKDHT
ncbi:extracellular solute-binding protein [Salinispira pacifica]